MTSPEFVDSAQVHDTSLSDGNGDRCDVQFGTGQLAAFARALADRLKVADNPPDQQRALRARFQHQVDVITQAYRLSLDAATDSVVYSPVADWLLDNYYVIHEQIRDIRDHLPPSFFRELPKLSDGTPRVYVVANALATHCDCAFDEDLIQQFVDAFQSNVELTIGETWAVPVMLRIALIETLHVICEHLIADLKIGRQVEHFLKAVAEVDWQPPLMSDELPGELAQMVDQLSPAAMVAIYDAIEGRNDLSHEAQDAIERHLRATECETGELRKREQHRLAENQVSIGNIITSMRLLGSLDWIRFFELTNRSERILRCDPANVYPEMDFASRNRYRDAIEQLARGTTFSETYIARRALELASESDQRTSHVHGDCPSNHIGYWLVDEGRRQLETEIDFRPSMSEKVRRFILRNAAWVYFGGYVGLALLMCLLFLSALTAQMSLIGAIVLTLLAALPLSEVAQQAVNAVATRTCKIRLLPKIEFRDGVSQSYPTMIVVPSMLTSERGAHSLLETLENHYLTNADGNFFFALLTDFADATTQVADGDAQVLQVAVDGIRALNRRYATANHSPFFLFHRERRWNESQGCWMGWERKRGKLMELGDLLSGSDSTSYVVQEGDLTQLDRFRHEASTPLIITLDADTILPHDAARRLVGAMAHPLNRPVTEPINGTHRVVRGYSILQPRVSMHLGERQPSRYMQTQAISPGVDPYAFAASDVYQDLFDEGSFTGKGIYDLRAFQRTLRGVLPENQILSHDLIEGCHGRVALTSDIEVFDSYPTRYDVDAKRVHRWARGDWQISPWLRGTVRTAEAVVPNHLSALSKWKLFDNLRRTLVAPSLLAFLLAGWIFAPTYAWLWSIFAAFVVFFPTLVQATTGLINWTPRLGFREQLDAYVLGLRKVSEQGLYVAAFLPHKALQMVDAVVRTLYRMSVSGKNLLEWETAAASEFRLGRRRWSTASQLAVCSVIAVLAFFAMNEESRIGAIPWLGIWLMAPLIGHIISLPQKGNAEQLQEHDRSWLLQLASGTWGFFERYVNAEGNWLPPDNVQEYPEEKVALRISPTNEGLFLVSGLVARHYGFTGLHSLVEVWEKNLASWNSLEQLHGHHYNWYETQHLQPLHPYYASTVDSGNLAACYLTLTEGITELANAPIISRSLCDGLRASLDWLREQATRNEERRDKTREPSDRGGHDSHLDSLDLAIDDVKELLALDEITFTGLATFYKSVQSASVRLNRWISEQSDAVVASITIQTKIVARRLQAIDTDMQRLMPWLTTWDSGDDEGTPIDDRISAIDSILSPDTSLQDLAQLQAESNHGLSRQVMQGSRAARDLMKRLETIRQQCNAAVQAMDFRFLYNRRRKLFSIGFNADTGKLDRGHYDLLCSECRVASYLAIAKGDVEKEHWFRLGRQATQIEGRYSLLSWGGTMFEFLMPQLFQRSYPGSLLDTSCRTAVARQIEYGRQRGVPWGISESAFSAMNSNSDYQYKSFGVPGLGLKRGLSNDLVVSPYSSALALPFAPHAAVDNLQQLAHVALGDWGFYDAVDYTKRRLRRKPLKVVFNYMAHHQGMTLLAMANATDSQLVSKWFHSHPLVRANELLLQENVPHIVDSQVPNPDEVAPSNLVREELTSVSRQIVGVHSSLPRTLILSNGQFSSMLTHTGGGYTRHNDMLVTRWRSDSTLDSWGNYLYLRDRESGTMWSATYQPTRAPADHYEALFAVDKGEIRRRQGDIETNLEVVVSPEHNAEVRQLRISNHGATARTIEVTSYAEVALANPAADAAHPAFQKLFIETEFIAEDRTLIARRRPRSADDSSLFALHTLSVPEEFGDSVEYETSRKAFIGRGRTPESPQAMQKASLTNSVGAVLDPVFSLRCSVTIQPSESVTVGFTTAVAANREQALTIGDLYHDMRGVQRAIELTWAFAQIELRQSNLSAQQVHLFQRLGGMLLYPDMSLRGNPAQIEANRLGQRALWHFGISGDVPILLVRIADAKDIKLVKEVIAAHRFLTSRGLPLDSVIVNDHPGVYFDSLHEQLQSLLAEQSSPDDVARSNIRLLRGSQWTVEDHRLLDATASVLLRADHGSLAQQLEAASSRRQSVGSANIHDDTNRVDLAAETRRTLKTTADTPSTESSDPREREFANGIGGFVANGARYEIDHAAADPTPAPWSNVIANPRFGCLVTEAGGGYTWAENSRENKLTTWSNDPISDPAAEIVYVRDSQTRVRWSPIVSLDDDSSCLVTHGQGFSQFQTERDGLRSDAIITIHADEPLKFVQIKLSNTGTRPRRLQLTYYAETVLGVTREQTALHQVSQWDMTHDALLMTNGFHPEFNSQVVFLTMLGGDNLRWTADRRSFLGRNGSLHNPAGLTHSLDRETGAGLDPCLAMQGDIELAPGETKSITFVLGGARDHREATRLLEQFNHEETVNDGITSAIERWDRFVSALTVETPNRALDVLVNRWLPYQTLSCRIWGRSAFYQSGGAYGFRDQLQDVMALVYSRPDLAREQILRAAARQYIEGDVQHWWHPPDGRGTRTRFSDDFLFLPFVTLHYLQATHDQQILHEVVPFIESPPLQDDVHERYEQPAVSSESASLLEHCRRSIQYGMRDGRHGLPLMGCGDWNDGMNKIGAAGEGESVWVAWFQIVVLRGFADVLRKLDQPTEAETYTNRADGLAHAIDRHAWDGEWYVRAFFDDGTPLGSHTNRECQIDSLTQSWAAIAMGPNARSRQAFQAAVDRLVRWEDKIIQLFDPPFDKTPLDPGYIKGYVPGVRENGGQYTHGAIWMVQAATELGHGDLALRIFDALNPILHADSRASAEQYQLEPYVIAADVYTNAQHLGRGGWSWYTGSAGWMYRAAVELILGITIRGDRLSIRPCVPHDWNEFRFRYRRNNTTWHVHAIRAHDDSDSDDHKYSNELRLDEDGGQHEVTLRF